MTDTHKPTLFSGMQPTGNLHIGNYLGALKNWVNLQNSGEYNSMFCIVDYHALTGKISAEERRDQILKTAIEFVAAGIDPEKSILFVQSHVPEHTELAWIFQSVTPVAELDRMTQFKDKGATVGATAGLYTYPVLQAADILLYQGSVVPVGEDQVQHVEMTRDIARWFNNKYGDYFPEAKVLLTEIPRVKSLLAPDKKMSKSLGEGHVIEMADEPPVIMKKLKKAVTATDGGTDAPGVVNLLLLLKEFGATELAAQFEAAQADGSIRYGDLKVAVADAISAELAEFRERREELMRNHDEIADILAHGAEQAQARAKETMEQVRELIGVR